MLVGCSVASRASDARLMNQWALRRSVVLHRAKHTPPPGVVPVRDDTDLGRLIGLSDGVFAFALTLLVLSLTVPAVASSLTSHQQEVQLQNGLGADYATFLAYGFAFVMIATWWMYHHRTFRYIYKYDNTLVWLNFAVLLEISVMPFVLSVFARNASLPAAVALFAGVQAATGFTLNGIWRHAIHGDRLIHPDFDPEIARKIAFYGTLPATLFAVSVPLAFVSPYLAYAAWVGVFAARRLGRQYLS